MDVCRFWGLRNGDVPGAFPLKPQVAFILTGGVQWWPTKLGKWNHHRLDQAWGLQTKAMRHMLWT